MWYAIAALLGVVLIQGWQISSLREDVEEQIKAAHKCSHRHIKAAHENTRTLKKAVGALAGALGYAIKEEHEVKVDIASLLGAKPMEHTIKVTAEKVRKLKVTSRK